MNRKILLLFFCIIISVSHLSARSSLYEYGEFKANSTTYLFGDNVNIRSAASTTARVADKLPIGTELKIVEKSGETLVLNGIMSNWYKVSYSNGKTGYVWGGLLSIAYGTNGRTLLLTGITKIGPGVKAECRMVKANKLITSLEFDPHFFDIQEGQVYGYSVKSSVHDSRGLKKLEGILEINCMYEACGYPHGSIWIGFTENSLHYLVTDSSVSEAGLFSYSEKIVFPDDENGQKGKILKQTLTQEYDEKKEDYVTTDQKTEIYEWDGTRTTKKE